MADTVNNNKRIAKNTIFLFFRMILTMLVSLYTSRVVLNTLGVEDFGIQNVVGGFVSMFSLISGSINTTISRFLTYELALDNPKRLNAVFSTSINIQIILCAIIFVLAETIGLWFVNYEMTIPEERLYAANWVYQCSLVSFFVVLISAPYNAVIIAHEKMSVYAYFSILEVILKLLIVYLLVVSPWDKLIFYAFLLLSVSILMRFLYCFYCNRHFKESIYHFVFDKSISKEMGKFAGWNYLGASAAILRTQGLNVLMNLFFGVTVNAARGIATQVESAVVMLVNNFTVAINPQIVKTYAMGNREYLHTLIYYGGKYTYFLLLFLILPIFFEAPYILRIWLVDYPEKAVIFLRLTLLVILTDCLSDTLTMAITASGIIKHLHIMVGLVALPILPLAYTMYSYDLPDYMAYFICIAALIIKFLYELKLARDIVSLSIWGYVKYVLLKIAVVSVLSVILPFVIFYSLDESLARFFLLTVVSISWSLLLVYFIGFSKVEKEFVLRKAKELYFSKIKVHFKRCI